MDELRGLTIKDFPERYHQLINMVGIRAYVEMMQTYGGTYLYVPKADNMARMVRDAKIRKEFNGHNYRRLAVKYGLSEISVRNIVESEKGRPIPGQMTMFDMAK